MDPIKIRKCLLVRARTARQKSPRPGPDGETKVSSSGPGRGDLASRVGSSSGSPQNTPQQCFYVVLMEVRGISGL